MLNKYVPPSDDLVLGIAVRDSCVVAQFKQPSGKKKQSSDKSKPSGYTFEFKGLDSFLLPYNRVTVPSFDLLQDAAKYDSRKEPTGVSSSNEFVQVWTPHGRHKLSPSMYSTCARGLQSQAVVPLYNMALETESNKRKQNATRRNATWLNEYAKENSSSGVWAPIVLGLEIDDEEAAPEEDQEQEQSAQVVLDGVAFVGQKHDLDLSSQLKPHLNKLDKIPPTIAMLSTQSTMEFIEAARAGVNMLGTALPTIWSRSKRAFVVPFNKESNKRVKLNQDETSGPSVLDLDSDGCIDLHDAKWASDALPLTPGCTCMACSNDHSRAYIHHLVQAKELLAEILLFSHNLHHLRELCRALSVDLDGTYDFVKSQMSKSQISRELHK